MPIQSTNHIGKVIRDAVAFNARNWQGGTMNSDFLIQSIQDLFAVLEQRKIKFVLAGGIALLHYVEGRNTQDLDLLMTLPAVSKLPELQISSQDQDFVRAKYGELQIDILLTQNPLFKRVHSHYARVERFFDREMAIASVEGLLLLKLYALPSLYREGNFARVGIYENDVATLLHYYPVKMPALLAELARYVSKSDLAEIQGIVVEIQNRLKRFG